MVAMNPSHATVYGAPSVDFPMGTFTVEPGGSDLHPGPHGEYAVVRWIAPEAGRYVIKAKFRGEAGFSGTQATTTDVYVQLNGSDIVTGSINLHGSGNEVPLERKISVDKKNTVDFLVGYGNRSYLFDSTELSAEICLIPPSGCGAN